MGKMVSTYDNLNFLRGIWLKLPLIVPIWTGNLENILTVRDINNFIFISLAWNWSLKMKGLKGVIRYVPWYNLCRILK